MSKASTIASPPREGEPAGALFWGLCQCYDEPHICSYGTLVSYLVGALSPVSHKGLHQGWTQTSLHLQVTHFTSHTISRVSGPIYIPQALSTGSCIQQGDLFYSAGLHRNRCQPQPRQEKVGREFGKNADEWTRRVEIIKASLAVSTACMAIYWPTPGFKGKTFKPCALTRWDFNFCVHSSPLRDMERCKSFLSLQLIYTESQDPSPIMISLDKSTGRNSYWGEELFLFGYQFSSRSCVVRWKKPKKAIYIYT